MDQVLLFCDSRGALARLAHDLQGEALHGGCSDAERRSSIGRFTSGATNLLLLSRVGDTSIDLPEARSTRDHQRSRFVARHLDSVF